MFTCDAPYHNIRFYLLYLSRLKLTSNSSSLVAWVVVGWSCTTFTRTVMYIHILTVYPECLTVYPACLTDVHLYTEGKTNKITEMKILLPLDSGSAAMILLLIRFNQFGCHGVWMQQWPIIISYLLTNLLLNWKTWIWDVTSWNLLHVNVWNHSITNHYLPPLHMV